MRTVIKSFQQSVFMANPATCANGWVGVWDFGFHLGYGQVCPQIVKTAVIMASPWSRPKRWWDSSWECQDTVVHLYVTIWTWPACGLILLISECLIWSSGVKVAVCGCPLLHFPLFPSHFLLCCRPVCLTEGWGSCLRWLRERTSQCCKSGESSICAF